MVILQLPLEKYASMFFENFGLFKCHIKIFTKFEKEIIKIKKKIIKDVLNHEVPHPDLRNKGNEHRNLSFTLNSKEVLIISSFQRSENYAR